MAYKKTKVTKRLYFNVPKGADETALNTEIGEFVIDEILRDLSQGKSPVSGKNFKKLNKLYADDQKGGDTTPNLELEGDMLSELTWKPAKGGIEIGFFDDNDETAKAYGHNTGMKGHKTLSGKVPQRQFIPRSSETFKGSIEKGIKNIIKEYKPKGKTFDPDITSFELDEGEGIEITLEDIFSQDLIGDLLGKI